jgi:hypothetical protein
MFGETAALLWTSAKDFLDEFSGVHAAGLSCLVLLEVCFVSALLVSATAAAFCSSPIEELCEKDQVCNHSRLFDVRLVYFLLMFLAGAALNCKEFLSIPLV